MIILGIDPGLAIVGYGIIEYKNSRFQTLTFGAIQTPAHTPVQKRLSQIYEELNNLIQTYHPDCMAVEELFFNTNVTTGITVAEARGIILLCGEKAGLEIYEYTPLQVKQAVVGYGKASKAQVILMVKTLLCLTNPPKLDDTCDALAIAICHAHTGGSRLKDFYNLR
jgi:crossover junction endodeoxyribonuclease RuvC